MLKDPRRFEGLAMYFHRVKALNELDISMKMKSSST